MIDGQLISIVFYTRLVFGISGREMQIYWLNITCLLRPFSMRFYQLKMKIVRPGLI